MKTLLFVVLAVASLGTSHSARATNYFVSLTDSNTTSDSTGSGLFDTGQFTCDSDPSNFFCTEGGFVCYGWSNCNALGATNGTPNLATFLEWSGAEFAGTFTTDHPAAPAPEPASLLLLGSGLIGIAGLLKRKVAN